jgi:hypothetical protein
MTVRCRPRHDSEEEQHSTDVGGTLSSEMHWGRVWAAATHPMRNG